MKTKYLIFSISLLSIFSNLSGQTKSQFLNLEVNAGLAFNHQNLIGSAGLHLSIGPHLNAGLFLATDPIGSQEIHSIVVFRFR
jgi:hypothetical protein